MVRVALVVLSMVAAVIAQSTNAYGPLFDPSNAPFFGSNSLVYPDVPTLTNGVPTFTQTPTFVRSSTSSADTISRSTQVSSSTSGSSSASHTASSSSVIRTSSATASASTPAQSTNAAAAKYPGVVGVIAGGLAAGMMLV
ncbi:hypothetical protein T440DRAFT_61521 [Plenodomus tracheiphilus IPT5]|uniref:Uncharacterized protein n=1 Tax=Plenodomus tracheiphilus IPT5 TaxID=1408161 RepID=A0A6A7BAH5_9PLEO|nr:hypothetical protein T440DRAFT_61521 [Plenodomus tracheiphilus IPT5]